MITLGELKKEIFNLNFEDFSEYQNYSLQVTDAINRAMSIITSEVRPLIKSCEISCKPLTNIMKNHPPQEIAAEYDGQAELCFMAEGNAVSYCFECDGEGTAIISDENGTRSIRLDAKRAFKEYKGFCKGQTLLKFTGEFAYNIKNPAFYDKKLSAEISDIPSYKRYNRYDLKELSNGKFIKLISCIFEGSSRRDDGYYSFADFHIEGKSTILLPSDKIGQFKLFYNCDFEHITKETPDSFMLELDNEAVSLLPLLCAYFVWIDDERSRSQEYYAQYEMRRDMLLLKDKSPTAAVLAPKSDSKFKGGML